MKGSYICTRASCTTAELGRTDMNEGEAGEGTSILRRRLSHEVRLVDEGDPTREYMRRDSSGLGLEVVILQERLRGRRRISGSSSR